MRSTGVSTEPVRQAADAFLASLTPEQRAKTMFPVDDPEWRKWMNQDFYVRQGVSFKEMTEAQREAAIGLLRASLSAKGLQLTRDIMRLNHTLGELNNNDFERVRRMALLDHRDGHPISQRALGMATRRAPRDHQLLRVGRSGGDDADVLRRLRAGARPRRQVQRDHRAAGRAEPGTGDDQRPHRRPAGARRSSTCPKPGTTSWPKRSRTTSSSSTSGIRASELAAEQQMQLLALIA